MPPKLNHPPPVRALAYLLLLQPAWTAHFGVHQADGRFLFHFRAKHAELRLEELRQVCVMLGFGAPRVLPCAFEAQGRIEGEEFDRVESMGGDVGPSVFQWVWLPSAAAAAAVAKRCVLVRSVLDVWASGSAHEGLSWSQLAERVDEWTQADVERILRPLAAGGSWKADIVSFGKHKPYTSAQKVELLKHFSKLLWAIPGPVALEDPEHYVTFLEDYGEAAARERRPPRRGGSRKAFHLAHDVPTSK